MLNKLKRLERTYKKNQAPDLKIHVVFQGEPEPITEDGHEHLIIRVHFGGDNEL